jgi:hypothetical protein
VHRAASLPARGSHLHDQPTPALRAVARWLELARSLAGDVLAADDGLAAAVAVTAGCGGPRHSPLASALIGIFRSFSMARSASAARPSVVR